MADSLNENESTRGENNKNSGGENKPQLVRPECSNAMKWILHDVKSPLWGIKLSAGLLSRGKLDTEELNEVAVGIMQNTDKIYQLIDNIMHLTALDEQQIEIHQQTFDLIESVRTHCSTHARNAMLKEISFELPQSTERAFVYTDERYCMQIIENIVSNAIKFSPHGSLVSIHVESNAAYTLLHVTDSGPGISVKDTKRLYKRFVRLSAQPTAGEGSTGVGLAVAKELADCLGISIETRNNAQGATFTLKIPNPTFH